MKKVGILTIFGEYNYGNRLQNYAVQRVLEKNNHEVETIKYMSLDVNDFTDNKNRLKLFQDFNKNIKFCKDELHINAEEIPTSLNEFDYIVIGSDQIWNFTFDKLFSSKVFADFVPSYKRISFSASFGISFVPQDKEIHEICQKNLNEIKAISVREDAGKDIVEKMTGRKDVEVLIDPTMMLDACEWEKLAHRPSQLKTDRFILKGFLGNVSENQERELERIAKENDCEIIDILDRNSPFYETGPAEFLYLEKNAFLVATDSFHSCVFATLFSTPFVVFKREDKLASMNSRIETLLTKLDMQDRFCSDTIDSKILSDDYSKQFKILEKEREKVTEFLNKNM